MSNYNPYDHRAGEHEQNALDQWNSGNINSAQQAYQQAQEARTAAEQERASQRHFEEMNRHHNEYLTMLGEALPGSTPDNPKNRS